MYTESAFSEKKNGLRLKSLRYLVPAVLVALVTAAGFPLHTILHPTNLLILYLSVVVLSALYTGRGPAVLTSSLAMLSFDYFFVEPRLSLTVTDSQYIITLVGFLMVALIISSLTAQVKEQVSIVRKREEQTAAVNTLSRDLAGASGLDRILRLIIAHAGGALDGEIFILLPGLDGQAYIAAASPDAVCADTAVDYASVMLDGRVPDFRPGLEDDHFFPLKTSAGIQGILIVHLAVQETARADLPRQSDAFFNLAALAIERTRLEEKANQARVLESSEKLQTALLRSISHDLRTPLAAISGALDSLYEGESADTAIMLPPQARLELIQTGREEVARLNQLVGNILDMTRLEAGAMHMKLEEIDLQDLIGASLRRMGSRLERRPLKVDLDDNLPYLKLDFVLMEQVLVNLLDNAVKYSPEDTPIDIRVNCAPEGVRIGVYDRGAGIPEQLLAAIFDKFFRVNPQGGVSGSGLGLTICKGIVEAHNGRIRAKNRPDGGAVFHILLPYPADAAANKGAQS